MPIAISPYPEDKTGTLASNLVTDTIPVNHDGSKRYLVIYPFYAPFYKDDLKLVTSTGITLTEGSQYRLYYKLEHLSDVSGKEVYECIALDTQNISGLFSSINIEYRTVGGNHTRQLVDLDKVLEKVLNTPYSNDPIGKIGEPNDPGTGPAAHTVPEPEHFQPLVTALEKLRNSISLGDNHYFADVYERLGLLLEATKNDLDDAMTVVDVPTLTALMNSFNVRYEAAKQSYRDYRTTSLDSFQTDLDGVLTKRDALKSYADSKKAAAETQAYQDADALKSNYPVNTTNYIAQAKTDMDQEEAYLTSEMNNFALTRVEDFNINNTSSDARQYVDNLISNEQTSIDNNTASILGHISDKYSGSLKLAMFNRVCLTGPSTVGTNQVATFKITNYQAHRTYLVNILSGSSSTVNVAGDTITFTAGSTANANDGFYVNGTKVKVNVVDGLPPLSGTPTITYPANGQQSISTDTYVAASLTGVTTGGRTVKSSDWELYEDSGLTSLVTSVSGLESEPLKWYLKDLTNNKTYYVRVRLKFDDDSQTGWSAVRSFTTREYNYPSLKIGTILPEASAHAATGALLFSYAQGNDAPYSIATSPRGNLVAFIPRGDMDSTTFSNWNSSAHLYFRTDEDLSTTKSFVIRTPVYHRGPRNAPLINTGRPLAVALSNDPDKLFINGYTHLLIASINRPAYRVVDYSLITSTHGNIFGTNLSVSEDGSVVATNNGSGTVYLFELVNDEVVNEYEFNVMPGASNFGKSFQLSGDGKNLVIGGGSTNMEIYHYVRKEAGWVLETTISPSFYGLGNVNSFGYRVGISYDGKTIAAGAPYFSPSIGTIYFFRNEGSGYRLVGTSSGPADGTPVSYGSRLAVNREGTAIVATEGVSDTHSAVPAYGGLHRIVPNATWTTTITTKFAPLAWEAKSTFIANTGIRDHQVVISDEANLTLVSTGYLNDYPTFAKRYFIDVYT